MIQNVDPISKIGAGRLDRASQHEPIVCSLCIEETYDRALSLGKSAQAKCCNAVLPRPFLFRADRVPNEYRKMVPA